MSDEVKNAELRIPQSMVLSVLFNGAQTFILVIVLLLCIGDPVAALNSPTGYPVIEILRQATGSKAGATVLMAMSPDAAGAFANRRRVAALLISRVGTDYLATHTGSWAPK